MKSRMEYWKVAPGGFKAMTSLEDYLRDCGLEKPLLLLVKLRASQINGCAFCINMHWKDARAVGESEQRLYGLTVWRDVPYYTDRERAALKWTEALTKFPHGRVTDATYDAVRGHFTEKELADLTYAVAAINAWNRVSIAYRSEAGEHKATAHKDEGWSNLLGLFRKIESGNQSSIHAQASAIPGDIP